MLSVQCYVTLQSCLLLQGCGEPSSEVTVSVARRQRTRSASRMAEWCGSVPKSPRVTNRRQFQASVHTRPGPGCQAGGCRPAGVVVTHPIVSQTPTLSLAAPGSCAWHPGRPWWLRPRRTGPPAAKAPAADTRSAGLPGHGGSPASDLWWECLRCSTLGDWDPALRGHGDTRAGQGCWRHQVPRRRRRLPRPLAPPESWTGAHRSPG